MICYSYDFATGAYQGEMDAPRDPLTPDSYLYPAFTTETPPPDEADGYNRCFIGGVWKYVAIPQPVDDTPTPPDDLPHVVDSVSSRQFMLQLLSMGLLDNVNAWVASQGRAIQIAFEFSGSFLKTEPMMAEGFAAMGFTEEQVDQFFIDANNL